MEFMRWDLAPRWPFDAAKSHAHLGSSAGNEGIPRQKNHAFFASLTGNQVMHTSVFVKPFPVASFAGQEAMPCSDFAKAWRLENEANRAYRFVLPGGDTAAVARLCS